MRYPGGSTNITALSCPVCGSQKIRVCNYVRPDNNGNKSLSLMICEHCGHGKRLYKTNLESNLQTQRDFFDSNIKKPVKKFIKWPHRPALIASQVRRLAGKGGRALDVGCGTGMWLAALGNGWEKHGVEVSENTAAVAEQFASARVHHGPIETYRCEENYFDLITAFALIEHLSEPREFLRWTYRHLKTGGLLVLMTGDRQSKTAVEMGENWPLYYSQEHVSFFSDDSLTRMVKQAGFSVVLKEWRFMYTPNGMGSPAFRLSQKLREIMKMVTKPEHDHFYLYARKI